MAKENSFRFTHRRFPEMMEAVPEAAQEAR